MIRYVYVAGPLTKGPWSHNQRAALDAAAQLADAGCVPYVPHLSVQWDTVHPRGYEFWMEQCLAWVERCDVLLRLPGESPGADREVEHAKRHGMAVFHSVGQILEFLPG